MAGGLAATPSSVLTRLGPGGSGGKHMKYKGVPAGFAAQTAKDCLNFDDVADFTDHRTELYRENAVKEEASTPGAWGG